MDEILTELRAMRVELEALKDLQVGGGGKVVRVPKIPRVPCIGVTGKGTPCRNGAQPGHEYCRMHGDRPAKEVKPKKLKKSQSQRRFNLSTPMNLVRPLRRRVHCVILTEM